MQIDDGPKPEDRIDEEEVVRKWTTGSFILTDSLDDALIVIKILKRRLDESACGLFFGYSDGGVAIHKVE